MTREKSQCNMGAQGPASEWTPHDLVLKSTSYHGLISGPEKLLCSCEKEKLIFCWPSHSGKVNMKEEELPLSKNHQNGSVFFKLPHWFLASGNRLKGLTISFSPCDIHMPTHPPWHVKFLHWAASWNEGTCRYQWQNKYMQPQEVKGGMSHDEPMNS